MKCDITHTEQKLAASRNVGNSRAISPAALGNLFVNFIELMRNFVQLNATVNHSHLPNTVSSIRLETYKNVHQFKCHAHLHV